MTIFVLTTIFVFKIIKVYVSKVIFSFKACVGLRAQQTSLSSVYQILDCLKIFLCEILFKNLF